MNEPIGDAAFDALVRRHRRESLGQSMEKVERRREAARQQALVEESGYHQIRVLILVSVIAGRHGVLDGLTKLAKLDFLLRYPLFLEIVSRSQGIEVPREVAATESELHAVESRMVRYKYGPWDDRYYAIIGGLVGRGLVEYVEGRGRVGLRPTDGGFAIAERMSSTPEWELVARRCQFIREYFRQFSGNRLKNLIYEVLPDVVDRPHRTEI